MSWVKRAGRRYFYKSQREGDRVRTIYVGKGAIGRMAELEMAMRKEVRELPRKWLKWAAEAFAKVDELDATLTVELSAVLFVRASIRLDARRARRILRTDKEKIMDEKNDENILPMNNPPTWQELTIRASKGDREAAKALIPMLDGNPELISRWGDFSRIALSKWLKIVADSNELIEAAVCKRTLALVQSVRRFENDPVEETLARRVGMMWLQVTYFDSQVAQAVKRTFGEQTFLGKRQKDSQQLYVDTTKALREYQAHHDSVHSAATKAPEVKLAR